MEEQKFELELRMSEEGIVCNAKALEAMLPEKLKPYNYVVTINNYQDAKKDRTKLNNLVKVLQTKRKQFEETELSAWKDAKAALMRVEKIILEASDNLASGIRDIDEKEKVAKMEEVRESFDLINLPIPVTFDKLYDRSAYDKKSMSVKNIMEDMQLKIDHINSDYQMMKLFMPDDLAEAEQVKRVYAETLSVTHAKGKADELKAIRQKVEKEEIKKRDNTAIQVNHEPFEGENKSTVEPSKKIQRIKFEIIADRSFFDDMNKLILKYKPKVTVIEKEDIE